MRLNDIGKVAHRLWEEIPTHFPKVETDAWVVMPNHVHGVIIIADPRVGATHASPLQHPPGPRKRSLGTIVGAYKFAVSEHVNRSGHPSSLPIWQRNYYDHVIRDDVALDRIRQYIADNPARWAEDPKIRRGDGVKGDAVIRAARPWSCFLWVGTSAYVVMSIARVGVIIVADPHVGATHASPLKLRGCWRRL